MEIVFLLIGVVIGAFIAWALLRAGFGQRVEQAVADHPVTRELRTAIQAAQQELREERAHTQRLTGELATAREQVRGLEERLASQVKELEELRRQIQLEFQNLANRIFDEKSQKFTQQNKEQLDGVLTPLRERLKDFEEKVEKTYGEEARERIKLKKEIDDLMLLNKKLSSDAENLTTALKGDNKTQGNWGEMVLEKVLERSGLQEGLEYKTQFATTNQDGERIKPDVVVFLPENRNIIIDAKVSMLAYEQAVSATDDTQRERFIKLHVDSVRAHVKGLGEKNYHTSPDLVSPDFILLFLPIEAAFSLAVQADPELYAYAWDRKIVIVSPTTLLATLRTVDNIWRQENRTRNAELIADEAGKLYDKFKNFTEDLIDLGKKMDQAKGSYSEAMKKLSEGTGNLVGRAEKMRKLGAKTQRRLDARLLERSGEQDAGALAAEPPNEE